MGPGSATIANDQSSVMFQWSARKVPPIVLLYVAIVFLVMMALAFFVVHSVKAVTVLAMTAVGSMVPLVPSVLQRVEFRLTGGGLEKRSVVQGKPRPFDRVFRLDELSHVKTTRHGLKFYKELNESSPFRRFWKLHVSDKYSGEVRVEAADQKKVLAVLAEHGVSVR